VPSEMNEIFTILGKHVFRPVLPQLEMERAFLR
jgi:hypothetical protein